jgi:hypothetical protein
VPANAGVLRHNGRADELLPDKKMLCEVIAGILDYG